MPFHECVAEAASFHFSWLSSITERYWHPRMPAQWTSVGKRAGKEGKGNKIKKQHSVGLLKNFKKDLTST